MPSRIYIVRHGETEWSKSGQHTGRTDIPLTAEGEAQAAALRAPLAAVSFARVLSSPLQRARRTADLAGFAGRYEVTDLLAEVDYGADEGRTRVQIRAERPGWDFFTDGPLGGETIAQAAARAQQLIDTLGDGDVLVFSHGHLSRIFAGTFLRVGADFGRRLTLRPATISVLGYEHECPAIQSWNLRPA